MLFGRKKQIELTNDQGRNSRDQSYWALVRRQFRKNKPALWSVRCLFVLLFVAVFGDFIANEKPIYCQFGGKTYFPVLKQYAVDLGWDGWGAQFFDMDWKTQEYETVLWPLITYSANGIDRRNSPFKSPFDAQNVPSERHWHWLGTDELGRDVAAGMVAGTRTAMLVGVISMSIASFLGILLGSIAGFFGDYHLRMTRIRGIFNILGVAFGIFYGFMARSFVLSESPNTFLVIGKGIAIFLVIMGIANALAALMERIPGWGHKRPIPIDMIIMRLIEVLNAMPGLLLLLAILSIIERPNIFHIMMIIGLISWSGIARFIRAELLRVREMEYVKAAQAMGFSSRRVVFRHAIPNAIGPVLVSVAFGVASAILIEATLTFLGIGLSLNHITWGSLLREARTDFSAWWVAMLPGFAIFITVTIFNLIGDALGAAINPHLSK